MELLGILYNNPFSDIQLTHAGRGWYGEPHRHFFIIPIDDYGTYIIVNHKDPIGQALYPDEDNTFLLHDYFFSIYVECVRPKFKEFSDIGSERDQFYWLIEKDSGSFRIISKQMLLSGIWGFFTPDSITPPDPGEKDSICLAPLEKQKELQQVSQNPLAHFEIKRIYSYDQPEVKNLNDDRDIDFPDELKLKYLDQGLPRFSDPILRGETIIPFIFIKDEDYSPGQQLDTPLFSPYYKLSRYQYWFLEFHETFTGKIHEVKEYQVTETFGVSSEHLKSMSKTTGTTIDEEASISVSGWGASASAKISQQLREDLNVATSTSKKEFKETTITQKVTLTMPSEKCTVAKWRLWEEYRVYRMEPYKWGGKEKPNDHFPQKWGKQIAHFIVKREERTYENSYPSADLRFINKDQ